MGNVINDIVHTVMSMAGNEIAAIPNYVVGLGKGVVGSVIGAPWAQQGWNQAASGLENLSTVGTFSTFAGGSPSQDPPVQGSQYIPPPLGGTPSGTASSGGTPSTGSAGTPAGLSPSMKAAITGAITGQLPGLISADEATGMTGLTPQFLTSQAGEASGFTNQQSIIQQAVNNWLSQNNVALP